MLNERAFEKEGNKYSGLRSRTCLLLGLQTQVIFLSYIFDNKNQVLKDTWFLLYEVKVVL